jgi:C1A family cysteine protease
MRIGGLAASNPKQEEYMATKKKKSPRRKKKNEKRILNVLPSKNTEKDWAFTNAAASGVVSAPAALPASKDLRESWWKIGNQGSSGSCVGWGTADSLVRWHLVKGNQLAKDEKLSVRYVWMASKETDEFTTSPTTFIESDGTSLKSALDIVRKYGIVKDKVLPFASGVLYKDEEKTFYALAAQRKIASYFNLGRNISNWRTWLATKGPILTRLDVDATWDNASATNGKLDIYQPNTTRGGHCVALVGYTPDRFIVRNSWGTTWGDGGFAFASLQYAQAAFTEAYGVTL